MIQQYLVHHVPGLRRLYLAYESYEATEKAKHPNDRNRLVEFWGGGFAPTIAVGSCDRKLLEALRYFHLFKDPMEHYSALAMGSCDIRTMARTVAAGG